MLACLEYNTLSQHIALQEQDSRFIVSVLGRCLPLGKTQTTSQRNYGVEGEFPPVPTKTIVMKLLNAYCLLVLWVSMVLAIFRGSSFVLSGTLEEPRSMGIDLHLFYHLFISKAFISPNLCKSFLAK